MTGDAQTWPISVLILFAKCAQCDRIQLELEGLRHSIWKASEIALEGLRHSILKASATAFGRPQKQPLPDLGAGHKDSLWMASEVAVGRPQEQLLESLRNSLWKAYINSLWKTSALENLGSSLWKAEAAFGKPQK